MQLAAFDGNLAWCQLLRDQKSRKEFVIHYSAIAQSDLWPVASLPLRRIPKSYPDGGRKRIPMVTFDPLDLSIVRIDFRLPTPKVLHPFWIQSNPLNGSPDYGSIWLIVQDLAGPTLQCFLSNPLSYNGSIRFLVQFLAGPTAEPLSGSDCIETEKFFHLPTLAASFDCRFAKCPNWRN